MLPLFIQRKFHESMILKCSEIIYKYQTIFFESISWFIIYRFVMKSRHHLVLKLNFTMVSKLVWPRHRFWWCLLVIEFIIQNFPMFQIFSFSQHNYLTKWSQLKSTEIIDFDVCAVTHVKEKNDDSSRSQKKSLEGASNVFPSTNLPSSVEIASKRLSLNNQLTHHNIQHDTQY